MGDKKIVYTPEEPKEFALDEQKSFEPYGRKEEGSEEEQEEA